MTVSASYAPLVSAGNDATTEFSPSWPFFSSAEIKVTLISSAGVETVKSLTTHYTVSGGTDANGLPATGTITMLTAPATGETLVIERVTTNTQATSYANNDAFGAKTHEAAYDRRTLVEQEAKEIAGRALQANPKLTLTGRNFKVAGSAVLIKWDDATGFYTYEAAPGEGDMLQSTYDPAVIEEQLVGLTATQTLTNKTLRAVDGSAEAPSIGFTSDTDNGLYRSGTDLWHLVGGGTARLSVDGVNGHIGIGTTSPNGPLHVKGSLAGANIPITAEGGGNTTASVQLLIRNPNDITPGAGNDYENECHIRLWAGTTADHRSYINFADYTGTDKWLTGRNASDTWILYSSVTGHRMRFWNGEGSDYGTDLSSYGAYPVRINVSETGAAHGTGGFEVWSGGTVPTVNMFDVARYDNDTIMISVVNNGAGYAPASLSLTAKQSATRGQGVFLHNSVSQTSWYSGVAYDVAGLKYIIGYASQATLDPVLADTSNALLTITSTGNVGIGTTTPGAKLDVDGIIRPKSYTVATLPAVVTGGILYASDGRKAGEGAGLGTGVLVFADGSNWIAVDTGATVAA